MRWLRCPRCATPPSDPAARAEFEATNDPLEPMNRKIFDFNLFLDRFLIKPVAQGYRTVLPQFSRNAMRHFLDNLGEPVIFANDMMQGELAIAQSSPPARFLINSTFGVGGLFDFAGKTGVAAPDRRFRPDALCLGRRPKGPIWCCRSSARPIRATRSAWGSTASWTRSAISPAPTVWPTARRLSRMAASGVDLRARNIETLDDLQRNAIDFYAEMRSLFRQHRASELRHGRSAPTAQPRHAATASPDRGRA